MSLDKISFPNISIGLVHHPVVNKKGEIVTTSVTNLDIHDIARTCRTYGIKNYFIITPLTVQHGLIERILSHWKEDTSGEYNPDRQDALQFVKLVFTIEESISWIESNEGQRPLIAITGAGFKDGDGETSSLMKKVENEGKPLLLLFGTGWGLSPEVLKSADFCLKHLAGMAEDGYNHLSVRSAVAIYCDRLMSRCCNDSKTDPI